MSIEIIKSEKFPLETGLKKTCRVMAMGDVHGHADLMNALIDYNLDNQSDYKKNHLVLLGDLTDRGPDSIGAIDLAIKSEDQFDKCHFIMGNHEILLRSSFSDEEDDLRKIWLKNGGEKIISELGEEKIDYSSSDSFRKSLTEALGEDRVTYIENLKSHAIIGDLLFVHAGVDPDLPLDEQFETPWNERTKTHWAWIREKFLHYPHNFPYTIIHGHTPVSKEPYKKGDKVNVRHRLFESKMNLDGGSYASGIVTAAIFTKHDYQLICAVYV